MGEAAEGARRVKMKREPFDEATNHPLDSLQHCQASGFLPGKRGALETRAGLLEHAG